jgi:hypothetical protein
MQFLCTPQTPASASNCLPRVFGRPTVLEGSHYLIISLAIAIGCDAPFSLHQRFKNYYSFHSINTRFVQARPFRVIASPLTAAVEQLQPTLIIDNSTNSLRRA